MTAMPRPPGMPEGCQPCWEELTQLREGMTRLESEREANRGVVRLPVWAVGLLWSILIVVLGGVVGGAVSLTKLEVRLSSEHDLMLTLQKDVAYHVQQPGHPGVLEKLQGVKEDVDEMKRRYPR